MNRWLIVRIMVVAATIAGGSALAANYEALNEVLKLKNAGIDQETIQSFVKSKPLNYNLTADDIVTLQKQGFTPGVINAMVASGIPATTPTAGPAPATPSPVVVQAPPQVISAPALGPDVTYFYQELSPYGRWFLTEENQWCWQPTAAATSRDWRPYWDRGHWVYSDAGWYWSSEYSWGWAPFHYGRWQLHPHHGWIWMPDRVWGPSWVVWREGGDYCGWAPLPPGARFDIGAGAFFWHDRRVEAGFDFGLGFAHFNFTLVKEMGNPVRSHFRRPAELEAVFRRTSVVNRYTVVRPGGPGEHAHIVNHGIELARVNEHRGHKIEEVHIEDSRTPFDNKRHERFDKDHHVMEVYRPRLPDHGPRR